MVDRSGEGGPAPLHLTLRRRLASRPDLGAAIQIAIGVVAALVAVAIRYALPLEPQQLPTITVVIAIAVVTTFTGFLGGVVTAILGGLLSWYVFFRPNSWDFVGGAWVPLIGFVIIAAVIISTSWLYRSSERSRHEIEIQKLENERTKSELFAREMAHRLNNALTIVQSIAFQTIGSDSADAKAFAGRLRALSNANSLLTEDVARPSATAVNIIRAALAPFEDTENRIEIRGPDAVLNGSRAVSLALSVHELATNAIKYGSLCHVGGRVDVELQAAGDRHLIIWKELDGPPVSAPAHMGFGTKLLKRAGGTQLTFEPDGLRCTIELITAR
ncbi:MAG: sensor histidine kinase [Sphingomicrobium sp.]